MSHDDNWFRHPDEEGLPQSEHGSHVSATGLGITFLAIVFGVLFVILLLVAYFNRYTVQMESRLVEGTSLAEPYMQYRSQKKSELALTGGPRWIDRDAGTVRISKDDAARLVIEEYASR